MRGAFRSEEPLILEHLSFLSLGIACGHLAGMDVEYYNWNYQIS
jgi:hypothetical protein